MWGLGFRDYKITSLSSFQIMVQHTPNSDPMSYSNYSCFVCYPIQQGGIDMSQYATAMQMVPPAVFEVLRGVWVVFGWLRLGLGLKF